MDGNNNNTRYKERVPRTRGCCFCAKCTRQSRFACLLCPQSSPLTYTNSRSLSLSVSHQCSLPSVHGVYARSKALDAAGARSHTRHMFAVLILIRLVQISRKCLRPPLPSSGMRSTHRTEPTSRLHCYRSLCWRSVH